MESLARFALAEDDGWTWLGGFPAGSADALIIDPSAIAPPRSKIAKVADAGLPEEGSLRELHEAGRAAASLQQLAYEVGRVLAKGRRGFWICESKHGLGIARLLERFGLELAQPIIWDRGESARGGRLRWILPVSRGRTRGLPSLPDLIAAPGTGLPDAVAEILVMTSSLAGQWVLEPFAGQPSLAQAALRLGRSWAGANPLGAVRGAIATALVSAGARAGELPVRWDGAGVRVRAGSELAAQLAFEPVERDAVPAAEPAAIAPVQDDAPAEAEAARADALRPGAQLG